MMVDAGPGLNCNCASVPAPCGKGNCQVASGPCGTGNCVIASGPCGTGNCVIASGPCVTGNCVIASGPCVTGNCVIASGPCGTGNCVIASGPCATGTCPSCETTGSGPDRFVAVPSNNGPAAPMVVSNSSDRGVWFGGRVPFWKKWFGKDESAAENCTGCTQPGSTATASRSPYPTPPADAAYKVARLPTDAAKPTDWRRSWGKPDTTQAVAVASKPAPVPTWPKDFDRDTKSATNGTAKSPTAPAKAQAAKAPAQVPAKLAASETAKAKSTDLPRAEKRKSDPLTEPDRYSKRPQVKNANAGAVAQATKDVENKYGSRSGAKPAAPATAPKQEPKVVKSSEESTSVGKATTNTKPPLGSRSVLAAYGDNPTGPVCYLPVPMVTLPQRMPPTPPGLASSAEAGKAQAAKDDDSQVNAFTPPGYGGVKGSTPETPMNNAFTGGVMPNSMARTYSGRAATMMPPGMNPMPMGMMPAPMPVSPAGYLPPAYRLVPPSVPVALPAPGPQAKQSNPVAPGASTPQDLMSTLQNALYPSQRERAAQALSACNWKANPEVVAALLLAAREDPAATVRSACVRCLGKMNVSTPGVTTALQGLRADADAQVRQALDEVLGTDDASKSDPSKVEPASATAPQAEK